MWVSTAIAGWRKTVFEHHVGGLAADAGQGLERLAPGRDLAAVALE